MSKLLMILLSAFVVQAENRAHVHGEAEVSIAFDGTKGKIVFSTPSEAIYGFEYAPKTKKDKQKKEDGLKKLDEKIGGMIVFPESSKCTIRKDVFEVNETGKHADIVAEYAVACESSIKEKTLVFKFRDHFKSLKKVKVQLLVDDIQKALDVTKSGDAIEIK